MPRRAVLLLWTLAVVLVATSTAWTADADPLVDGLFSKPGYVGLLARPAVCLSNCDGTVFTFGAEAGYRFIGLALRYAYRAGGHFFYPDLRLFWEFGLGRNLTLTPLVEFTPQVTTGSGSTCLQLMFRPGVRIGWAPVPYMMLFLEPFAMDVAFYTRLSSPGLTITSYQPVLRYNFGFGLQARF